MSGNNLQDVLDKKPDKGDVLNLLASYDDLWAEIGEGLKVEGRHIRGLRQTNGMSNKIKLSNILQSWMDTLCSEVTWDNIKKALEGPVVDAKAIARNIQGGETKPDKAQLLEVLAPIASKWSEIGNALNVRPDVIAGLSDTPSNVTKLSTILQKWLDTLSSSITWRNVIDVLERNVVDGGSAADQVRDFLKSDDGYKKYMNQ